MGIPDHLTCLLRNLYAGQEATELDMEQKTGSKLGKEYIKAIYCHPIYLTYMQSPYKLSVYLRLLIFLLAILIQACASSSLAFHMMYSAYKLNKQGNNIEP